MMIQHNFAKPAQGQATLSIGIEALPVGESSMQSLHLVILSAHSLASSLCPLR